jgi:hypothetical protein
MLFITTARHLGQNASSHSKQACLTTAEYRLGGRDISNPKETIYAVQ